MLLGVGILAFGHLLGWGLSPAPPSAPAASQPNPTRAYLNALDAELIRLQAAGSLEDPAEWLRFESGLPSPPEPLVLDDELRDRAELLDREWLIRRMPRPLGPRLTVEPVETEGPLTPEVEELLEEVDLEGSVSPAIQAALAAFSRVDRELEGLEQALKTFRTQGVMPPRMDASLVSIGRVLQLEALVDTGVGTRVGRRGVLAFLAPASSALRRAVLLLDAAVAQEPSAVVRARLANFSRRMFRHSKAFFYGEMAYLDPWREAAPGPKNAAQEVVLAGVAFRVAKPRRIAGLEWQGLMRSAAAGLKRALASPEGTGPLRAQAVRLLVEVLVDLGDGPGLNHELVAALPLLREQPEELAALYYEGAVLLEPGDPGIEVLRTEWPQLRSGFLEVLAESPRFARLVNPFED